MATVAIGSITGVDPTTPLFPAHGASSTVGGYRPDAVLLLLSSVAVESISLAFAAIVPPAGVMLMSAAAICGNMLHIHSP